MKSHHMTPLSSLNLMHNKQDRNTFCSAGDHSAKHLLLLSFFLLCVQLWILPAFGCRPQYDSGLELETFGYSIWTTVLNLAFPMNLFYRMHSVASLFEVFRKV
uniref:Uncharacterized protein n=1 Tax=Sinocyclocheilus grahami TaxID=75366 RepID=A0A672N4A0_SINGR